MGGEAQTPKSWMEIVWRQLISPHINLCRHMQGFAAFIALCMECLVAMQRLHSNICSRLQGFTAFIASCMECLVAVQQYMRNICAIYAQYMGNICAIYASGCRVAQHLLHRAWNVLVAMQLQHSNICEWLQGLHGPCSIMQRRIWIVAWAIWQQITQCCADEIPCRKHSCKEFPCSKNPSLFNIKKVPLPARFPFSHRPSRVCPDLPVSSF